MVPKLAYAIRCLPETGAPSDPIASGVLVVLIDKSENGDEAAGGIVGIGDASAGGVVGVLGAGPTDADASTSGTTAEAAFPSGTTTEAQRSAVPNSSCIFRLVWESG